MNINNNVVPIEITKALAKNSLGIKGLNNFSKLLEVVYINLLTTKLFEMMYYKRKLSEIDPFTQFIKHDSMPSAILNISRVFEEDILELVIC